MKAPFTALAAVLLAVVLAGCSASNMARPGDDGEPRLYSNNSTLGNRLAVEALQDKQVKTDRRCHLTQFHHQHQKHTKPNWVEAHRDDRGQGYGQAHHHNGYAI